MGDEALEEKRGWVMNSILCHVKPDPTMGTTEVL